ncbi:hypothetical protein LIER_05758 [Lithospermum erythrorhizon]|uniref:Uncharacterized protein n=1 Tax=Lithospermum erythrorhizon TaxID=34254 RepID=A0AAV3P4B4_LITER
MERDPSTDSKISDVIAIPISVTSIEKLPRFSTYLLVNFCILYSVENTFALLKWGTSFSERSVSWNSIAYHFVYDGVEMGCDDESDNSCKIVMDACVAASATQDQLGNFVFTRNSSFLALNTNGERVHLVDSS